MRHHDTAQRDIRRLLGQRSGNILIRQSVKPVASHALAVQFIGDREPVRHRRMPAMECRVEARHLRQIGEPSGQRSQHDNGRRIVQWRQRLERLDARQRWRVHHHRRAQIRTAVHDAVTETHEARLRERPIRKFCQRLQRSRMVSGAHHPVVRWLAVGCADKETALPADVFHFAALTAPQGATCDRIDGEFQAGRARIQNAQATIHASWPFASEVCMLREPTTDEPGRQLP